MMRTSDRVIGCYGLVVEEYTREFADELDKKPFDRKMLQQFANSIRDSGPRKFLSYQIMVIDRRKGNPWK